jgi:hypothetical protein
LLPFSFSVAYDMPLATVLQYFDSSTECAPQRFASNLEEEQFEKQGRSEMMRTRTKRQREQESGREREKVKEECVRVI